MKQKELHFSQLNEGATNRKAPFGNVIAVFLQQLATFELYQVKKKYSNK